MRALTRGIAVTSAFVTALALAGGTAQAKGPGASESEIDTEEPVPATT